MCILPRVIPEPMASAADCGTLRLGFDKYWHCHHSNINPRPMANAHPLTVAADIFKSINDPFRKVPSGSAHQLRECDLGTVCWYSTMNAKLIGNWVCPHSGTLCLFWLFACLLVCLKKQQRQKRTNKQRQKLCVCVPIGTLPQLQPCTRMTRQGTWKSEDHLSWCCHLPPCLRVSCFPLNTVWLSDFGGISPSLPPVSLQDYRCKPPHRAACGHRGSELKSSCLHDSLSNLPTLMMLLNLNFILEFWHSSTQHTWH